MNAPDIIEELGDEDLVLLYDALLSLEEAVILASREQQGEVTRLEGLGDAAALQAAQQQLAELQARQVAINASRTKAYDRLLWRQIDRGGLTAAGDLYDQKYGWRPTGGQGAGAFGISTGTSRFNRGVVSSPACDAQAFVGRIHSSAYTRSYSPYAFERGLNPNAFQRGVNPNAFERGFNPNAFRRGANPNAFTVSGQDAVLTFTAQRLDKYSRALWELLSQASNILGLTKPILAEVDKSGTVETLTAFQSRSGTQTQQFYQNLFTVPALAFLEAESQSMASAQFQLKPQVVMRRPPMQYYLLQERKQRLGRRHRRYVTRSQTLTQPKSVSCISQESDATASMVIGGIDEPQRIHLWENGSVLKWHMVEDTFRNRNELSTIERAVEAATTAWNQVRPGDVTFQKAESERDATFGVTFEERGGGTLAVAFFPASYTPGYSRVRVFDAAVLAENIRYVANVFAHEFGHVLGFRHSFALEKERQQQAGASASVDEKSIMSYNFPPLIDMKDVEESRSAYENFSGGGVFKLSDGDGNMVDFFVERVSAVR